MSSRLGPCPIPRCALEWFMAIGTKGMGWWILLSPLGLQFRQYLNGLPEIARIVPTTWAIALIIGGFGQIAALSISARWPQRWSALMSGLLWLYVGVSAYNSGLYYLVWPCLLFVCGQLYVAMMLRP